MRRLVAASRRVLGCVLAAIRHPRGESSPTLASSTGDAQLHVGFARRTSRRRWAGKRRSTSPASARTARPTASTTRSRRAVVLSDGTTKIALVSVDLVGFFYPNAQSVRKALPGFTLRPRQQHAQPRGPGHARPVGAEPVAERRRSGLPEARRERDRRRRQGRRRRRCSRPAPASAPSRPRSCSHDGREPVRQARRAGGAATSTPHGRQAARASSSSGTATPRRSAGKNTQVSADYVGYTVEAPARRSTAARSPTSPAPSAG